MQNRSAPVNAYRRSDVRRHLIIPDVQAKPGADFTHLDWAARAIVDLKPDVIVVLGDFWDLESLSTHDAPGSKEAEGRRVLTDIEVGNEAFQRLTGPMQRELVRRVRRHMRRWYPECHFLFGNHEDRLSRAIFRDPKWEGIISLDSLKTPGFTRHPFLKIVELDGISYCHYFPNPFSGRPIGGAIGARLNNIGKSFVQGHQQGFLYASKQYPDHVKHGLVCGRFYTHRERYRTQDVQDNEWNGIVMLDRVKDGDYDLVPLRIDVLRDKYANPRIYRSPSHFGKPSGAADE